MDMLALIKSEIVKRLKVPASSLLALSEKELFKENNRGHIIFLASLPKSGSTYISARLGRLLGYEVDHISDLRGGCEFDLYRPKLIDMGRKNVVVQQHTLATPGNIEYIKRYGLSTIVLLRDLREVIVSFKDHLNNESLYWPFLSVEEGFYRSLSNCEKIDFVIEFAVPWFLHFYISWYMLKASGSLPLSLFFYKDFVSNEELFFRKLIQSVGLEGNENSTVGESEINANYRVTNLDRERWREQISQSQLDKINDYTKYYPNVDFSPIGLGSRNEIDTSI